jgi:hypothetical protein
MVGNKGKGTAAVVAALIVSGSAEAALISFNQTFYNTGTTARRYTFVRSVPAIGSVAGGLPIIGSITATVADMNGNGASIRSNASTAVYTALIGSTVVQTMWNAPYEFRVDMPFGSGTTNPSSFASTAPPGVTGDLQLVIDFVLSAGDVASVAGTFDIPAPGSAFLLLTAGGVLGGRRRRA